MYVFIQKKSGAILKGSTAVHVYMYSSNAQIFHNVVILYHMRMIQHCMMYRFQFVLAPLPEVRSGGKPCNEYVSALALPPRFAPRC